MSRAGGLNICRVPFWRWTNLGLTDGLGDFHKFLQQTVGSWHLETPLHAVLKGLQALQEHAPTSLDRRALVGCELGSRGPTARPLGASASSASGDLKHCCLTGVNDWMSLHFEACLTAHFAVQYASKRVATQAPTLADSSNWPDRPDWRLSQLIQGWVTFLRSALRSPTKCCWPPWTPTAAAVCQAVCCGKMPICARKP